MSLDLSKPVVWTTLGNINETDCEVFIEWQKNDEEICFIKHWHFKGAEVKREPHVFKLKGIEAATEHNNLERGKPRE